MVGRRVLGLAHERLRDQDQGDERAEPAGEPEGASLQVDRALHLGPLGRGRAEREVAGTGDPVDRRAERGQIARAPPQLHVEDLLERAERRPAVRPVDGGR